MTSIAQNPKKQFKLQKSSFCWEPPSPFPSPPPPEKKSRTYYIRQYSNTYHSYLWYLSTTKPSLPSISKREESLRFTDYSAKKHFHWWAEKQLISYENPRDLFSSRAPVFWRLSADDIMEVQRGERWLHKITDVLYRFSPHSGKTVSKRS